MKKETPESILPAIPETLQEAAELESMIGHELNDLQALERELETKIDELKKSYQPQTQSARTRIEQLAEKLFIYANTHYEELTEKGKKKTVQVYSGSFRWYTTPPTLIFKKPEEDILKEMKQRRLRRHIRIREEIIKKSLIADERALAKLRDVTVGKKERFAIRPANAKSVLNRDVQGKKWNLEYS